MTRRTVSIRATMGGLLILSMAQAGAQNYTLTIVAQVGDVIDGHRISTLYGKAINDAGTIAFGTDQGIYSNRHFVAGGGSTIGGQTLTSRPFYPKINSSGGLVFCGTIGPLSGPFQTAVLTPTSILAESGGSIAGNPVGTISCYEDSVSAGDAGAVFLTDRGVYTAAGQVASRGEQINGSPFLQDMNSPRINNNGTILFQGTNQPHVFSGLFHPADALWMSNTVDPYLSTIGGRSLSGYGLSQPRLNNNGMVTFLAQNGIFTPTAFLIGSGGVIGGRTIQTISGNGALNDAGHIAIVAQFADGTAVCTGTEMVAHDGDLVGGQPLRIADSTPVMNNNDQIVFLATVGSNPGSFALILARKSVAGPTPVSVTPNTGSGVSQQFQFAFTDSNGYAALNWTYMLFSPVLGTANACFAAYYQPANSFYLATDAGTGWTGPVAPGGTLQNSQCTITGGGVSGSGSTLTVTLALNFNGSFGGAKTTYMLAADTGGLNSGWQSRGTWAIPVIPTPPTADSVTSSNQFYTLTYASVNGAGYLSDVYLLINGSVNGAGACFVVYDAPSNGFYLYNDAGTGVLGPMAPGSFTHLSNSQCTLNGSGALVRGSGNTLSVLVDLIFNQSFSGTHTIYLYAADKGGLVSGWQNRGTLYVPPNTPPTADPVSPNAGSGASQSFTFQYSSYSDVTGAGNLRDVYALFNSTVNGAGACFVVYDKGAGGFYLYNDAGIGVTGPLAPGAGTTLSNSQCALSGTGSSVSLSGHALTMVLNLTFNHSFAGAKTIFMFALDGYGGLSSGWQNRGTWTVP